MFSLVNFGSNGLFCATTIGLFFFYILQFLSNKMPLKPAFMVSLSRSFSTKQTLDLIRTVVQARWAAAAATLAFDRRDALAPRLLLRVRKRTDDADPQRLSVATLWTHVQLNCPFHPVSVQLEMWRQRRQCVHAGDAFLHLRFVPVYFIFFKFCSIRSKYFAEN